MVEHVFARIDQKRRLRVRYEATIWNFRSYHSLGFCFDLARRLRRVGLIVQGMGSHLSFGEVSRLPRQMTNVA